MAQGSVKWGTNGGGVHLSPCPIIGVHFSGPPAPPEPPRSSTSPCWPTAPPSTVLRRLHRRSRFDPRTCPRRLPTGQIRQPVPAIPGATNRGGTRCCSKECVCSLRRASCRFLPSPNAGRSVPDGMGEQERLTGCGPVGPGALQLTRHGHTKRDSERHQQPGQADSAATRARLIHHGWQFRNLDRLKRIRVTFCNWKNWGSSARHSGRPRSMFGRCARGP